MVIEGRATWTQTAQSEGRQMVARNDWQFRRGALREGTSWGKWRLDRKERILAYWDEEDHREYGVALERITSSAGMLDWIFQLAGKRWMNPSDLFDLIRAFDAIFYPQANLCSGGVDKKLPAAQYLTKRFAARA